MDWGALFWHTLFDYSVVLALLGSAVTVFFQWPKYFPRPQEEIAENEEKTRRPSLVRRLAQSHPLLWAVAWRALRHLPFLLPHDPSYRALRHFIAAVPDGLFLDVGANDGISLRSFRRFSRSYRVFSVEPNRIHERALARLKASDSAFDFRIVGLGAAQTTIRLYMPRYAGIDLHTFAAADVTNARKHLAAAFGNRIARRARMVVIEAEIIRGDDLSLSPTIIKIDTEGGDGDVLIGLRETIANARPFIIIEGDDAVTSGLLDAQGYVVLHYDLSIRRFTSRSASVAGRNLFAIPTEKLALLPFSVSAIRRQQGMKPREA